MNASRTDRQERLLTAIDDVVTSWPGVSRTSMFGCPSYVADGVLFAVVSEQGLSLTRLTDDQRADLARTVRVEPFAAGGRVVRRWATVRVDPDALDPVTPALQQSYDAAIV
jgi:hypothetical protein